MTQLLTLRVGGSLFLLVNTHSFWPCVRIGINMLLQQNQNPKPRPLLWPVVEDTDTKGPLLFLWLYKSWRSVAFIITVVWKLSAKGLGIWNNDPQKKNIKQKIYNENHCNTHAHIKNTAKHIYSLLLWSKVCNFVIQNSIFTVPFSQLIASPEIYRARPRK